MVREREVAAPTPVLAVTPVVPLPSKSIAFASVDMVPETPVPKPSTQRIMAIQDTAPDDENDPYMMYCKAGVWDVKRYTQPISRQLFSI